MKEFIFSDGYQTICLRVTGKFNIISGDSGAGKTYLRTLLLRFQEASGSKGQTPIKTFCDPFALVDSLGYNGQCLVLLDEDHRVDMLRKYMHAMQSSENYYIIITREGSKIFPYGIENEFTVSRTRDKIVMLPKYTDIHLTRNPGPVNQVIVEDSCLGLWVVKTILQKCGIPVISAGSKTKLTTKILEERTRSLVIFDTCGISGDVERLLHACLTTGSILFDSESLEWEIGHALDPEGFQRYEVPRDISYHSAEAYYTSCLVTLLEIHGISYSKSNDELTPLLCNGKATVHSRFCDLSSCPGSHTNIYKELRELDEIAR